MLTTSRLSGAGRHTSTDTMRLFYFIFSVWITLTAALKQPTSYCKCICFQNSTIIPLNSPPSESSPASLLHRPALFSRDNGDSEGEENQKSHHTLTCNDCNRAFCLDYNLPICKNAKEEDVFAQCFRTSLLSINKRSCSFSQSIITGCLSLHIFDINSSLHEL